jgi:hypothetical protein
MTRKIERGGVRRLTGFPVFMPDLVYVKREGKQSRSEGLLLAVGRLKTLLDAPAIAGVAFDQDGDF